MKKLLLLCLCLCLGSQAFSNPPAFDGKVAKRRVVFGIRGGVNINTFGPDIAKVWEAVDTPTKKAKVGWNIGFVFDCPILESFYFQAGTFYKTKGFILTESNPAYDRKIVGNPRYIEFPLLFSYRYNIKRGLQAEFNVGPYIAVAIGGTVNDIKYSYLNPPESGDEGGTTAGFNPDYIGTKVPDVKSYAFCGTDLESSFGAKKMDYGICFGVGLTINRFYVGFQYDLGLSNLRNEVCWSQNVRFRNSSATLLLGFNLFK